MTLFPVTIHHYLILSALLFCLGFIGIIIRRNLLIILMCLEVMLNAVNLTFVALARYYLQEDGHIITLFVMAIAAVEAAIGLGIVLTLFRNKESVRTDRFTAMKG